MANRFLNTLCRSVLAAVFVAAGCERVKIPLGSFRQKVKEDILAYGPDVNAIVANNEYVPRAIGAAGGYDAWIKATKIELNCLVTFYRPDGSFYLTEQQHEIYPWSNSVRISATEPQGNFIWQLSGNDFRVMEGADLAGILPAKLCERDYAKAVLDITTAPARLLDSEPRFTEQPEPVKIEGLWYYPIQRPSGNIEPPLYRVVFYQNRDSSLVDMIWFADLSRDKFLIVRGYDYRRVKDRGVSVPAKIEIFSTDAAGRLQQRLVTIDYK